MKKLIAALSLITIISLKAIAQQANIIELEIAEYNGSGKEIQRIEYMSSHDYLELAKSSSLNGVAVIGYSLSSPYPQNRTLFVFASGGQVITTTLSDK